MGCSPEKPGDSPTLVSTGCGKWPLSLWNLKVFRSIFVDWEDVFSQKINHGLEKKK